MKLDLNNCLWAGSEDALYQALAVEAMISSVLQQGAMKAGLFDEPDSPPFLKSGNTAIIPIKGSTVNTDSWLAEMFGLTTYPSLRRKAVAAAQDSSIEHILLDVDSPGGQVNGLADTADLLTTINNKVKPVTAFASGNMLSAAYWLGSSAGQVFAGRTSSIGSIGVIAVHMDMTGALEKDGVKPTVLRAGSKKALVNPYEPLSDAARAQAMDGLEAAYEVFVTHVAEARGVAYNVADKKMADGQVFFGANAQAANLIDGISSFETVLSTLQAQKKVDKKQARK